jgi:hypothetical protein
VTVIGHFLKQPGSARPGRRKPGDERCPQRMPTSDAEPCHDPYTSNALGSEQSDPHTADWGRLTDVATTQAPTATIIRLWGTIGETARAAG